MHSAPVAAAAVPRLRALAELAELAGTVGGQVRLAERVVELAGRLVGDAAILWLPTADNERLVCAAVSHPQRAGRELLAEIRAAVGGLVTGPVAGVVGSGQPLVAEGAAIPIDMINAHPTYLLWKRRYGVAAIAVLPLRSRGRAVGALAMSRDTGRDSYLGDDLLFLQALADVAAAGVDIDRLLTDSAIALDELRRQSELLNHVSDAVIVLDAEQRVTSWNTAAERIYGYTPGDVLGGDLFTLLATEYLDADGAPSDREQVITRTLRTGGWTGELRERHADGSTVHSLASFSGLPDNAAGPGGIVVVNRDVTEQRHKEHLANHDALTGLPNRRLLWDRLARAMDQAASSQVGLAVIFMDLNGFKAVNDRLGHDAGDGVLRITAQRLAELVRGADMVARLGGDEFVVIATEVTAEGAAVLGRRLLVGLSAPMQVLGETLVVPPSLGIALSLGAETPDALLAAADAAMYTAKQRGSGVAYAGVGGTPATLDRCAASG